MPTSWQPRGKSIVSTLSQSKVGKCPGLLEVSDFGARRILLFSVDGEEKTRPKGMGRPHQGSKVHAFRQAFGSDREIPAHVFIPFFIHVCGLAGVSYPKAVSGVNLKIPF